MTADPQTDRTTAIYDSIDAFQHTHRLPGLQHAQIRGLLAEHLARALPVVSSAVSATTTPADRAAVSAALWAAAEHHTVAEWICCDPIDPAHDLCVQGGAALRMLKALLVDDPEAWKPAPLLDEVMRLVPPPADRAAEWRAAADHLEAKGRPTCEPDGDCCWYDAVAELRRLAAETAGPETQAEAGPTAEELAGHLAAQRMSVLQGAFRILGWPPLQFEVVDDEAAEPDTGDDHSCADSGCTGEPTAAAPAAVQTEEATSCGPAPDECDAEAGEPCANHEREQAHAEGEHCFCGPECVT